MESICKHKNPQLKNVTVCEHALGLEDQGVKFYTGKAQEIEYRCLKCDKSKDYPRYSICSKCVEKIEEEGDWYVSGVPEPHTALRPFRFSNRKLIVDELKGETILASKPMNQSTTMLLLLTNKGNLWWLDIISGAMQLKKTYSNSEIAQEGNISLLVSPDDRYVVLSSVVLHHATLPPSNQGVVLDLKTSKDILKLDCGDYHTEQAPFPVAFIVHQDKLCLIHATDWNRLDITDLENRRLLTSRDFEKFSKIEQPYGDNNSFMTEWYGELKVSPNGERVATIGWMWNPIGIAFSFSVKKWIEGNQWEPENGESKKSYFIWDYFWHSPFLWLDNNRLCIWGAEGGQQSNDTPLNCVAIYNAEDEKVLKYFSGPTMDIFYFDQYLFSGIHGQKSGLTIWSVDEGCLLHTEDSFSVMEYIPGSKEFVTYCDGGEILFYQWSECPLESHNKAEF